MVSLSAFDDRAQSPTQHQLRSVLGRAYPAWEKLLTLIADQIEPGTPVWKFGTGWSLRIVRRARVIVYMIPQHDQFLFSMALGERAVAAAHTAKLAPSVLKVIDEAPRYAEGRGVRIPVRSGRQLTALARLAQIKHEN